MKRKIATLLTLALSTALLLGGCGSAGSKSDTMTVSEMLETVLKDNGGEVGIYVTKDLTSSSSAFGKDTRVVGYVYDGNTVTIKGDDSSNCYAYSLGEIAQGHDIRLDENWKDHEPVKVTLSYVTDETGNAIKFEFLDGMCIYPSSYNDGAFFNAFNRVTVYDKTYMTFAGGFDTGSSLQKWYIVIEDTESTKDKTIVCDEIGTAGMVEGELSVNADRYFTWE